MTCNTTTQRMSERGNALFLILIAVVLFAALSYAITQSNRSSGNAANETNLVASSTVTQYPSAIRTGITRMLLRGLGADDLQFHDPANYSGTVAEEIFHPSGGGVVYQNTDPNSVVAVVPVGTHDTQNWYFTVGNKINNIGTTANDIIAVLMDVKTGICQQINQQITGSQTIPASTLAAADVIDETIGAGNTYGPLADGQPFMCMTETGGKNFYYHVLLEQ